VSCDNKINNNNNNNNNHTISTQQPMYWRVTTSGCTGLQHNYIQNNCLYINYQLDALTIIYS